MVSPGVIHVPPSDATVRNTFPPVHFQCPGLVQVFHIARPLCTVINVVI